MSAATRETTQPECADCAERPTTLDGDDVDKETKRRKGGASSDLSRRVDRELALEETGRRPGNGGEGDERASVLLLAHSENQSRAAEQQRLMVVHGPLDTAITEDRPAELGAPATRTRDRSPARVCANVP
jgi:hypothetical protein